MAQSNWQKSMKNVSLHDNKRYKRQRYSCEVQLSKVDENRLKIFQSNELKYYNTLVSLLQNKARVYPASLTSLTQEQIKLFAALAFSGDSLVALKKGGDPSPRVAPFKDLWTVNISKAFIKSDMELLFDAAGTKVVLDPNTREAMASELLEFFIEQAHAFSSSVNSDKIEMAFKIAPQTLNTVELTQKRHNQLPKKSLNWVWDHQNECSLVKTPYTTQPLKITGINLNEDVDWDLLIIHQQPGVLLQWNTPWLVEFQKSSMRYQIKYLDMVNPNAGAAFNVAKKRR
jgi:hypothetical protein